MWGNLRSLPEGVSTYVEWERSEIYTKYPVAYEDLKLNIGLILPTICAVGRMLRIMSSMLL